MTVATSDMSADLPNAFQLSRFFPYTGYTGNTGMTSSTTLLTNTKSRKPVTPVRDIQMSVCLIQHGKQRRFAMPIPLRADFNARLVRATAKRSKDGPQARRLTGAGGR